jgi:hypothetical protein
MSDTHEEPTRDLQYLIYLTQDNNRRIEEQTRGTENWYGRFLNRHLGALATVIAAIITAFFGINFHAIGYVQNQTIGKIDHLLQQVTHISENPFPPEVANFVLSEKSKMENRIAELLKDNAALKDEHSKLKDDNNSLREQLSRATPPH